VQLDDGYVEGVFVDVGQLAGCGLELDGGTIQCRVVDDDDADDVSVVEMGWELRSLKWIVFRAMAA
jgi:hypothetical protein